MLDKCNPSPTIDKNFLVDITINSVASFFSVLFAFLYKLRFLLKHSINLCVTYTWYFQVACNSNNFLSKMFLPRCSLLTYNERLIKIYLSSCIPVRPLFSRTESKMVSYVRPPEPIGIFYYLYHRKYCININIYI